MEMQASPRCKALIAEFESCAEHTSDGRYRAYPDPASPMGKGQYPKNGPDVSKGAPWTIGFGATGPNITRGTVWTLDQCERAFDEHIAFFSKGVNKFLRATNRPTTQAQFDALVSFAYNVGLDDDADTKAEGLGDSTLLRKHLAGDHGTVDGRTGKGTGAAGEFIKWNKAQGQVVNGLTRRRKAEALMYVGHQ